MSEEEAPKDSPVVNEDRVSAIVALAVSQHEMAMEMRRSRRTLNAIWLLLLAVYLLVFSLVWTKEN